MAEELILRLRAALRDPEGAALRLDDLLDELQAAGAATANEGADGEVITLGRRQFAELLRAVTKPTSFGEALREQGFRPAVEARIAERKIHPRVEGGLKRYTGE